MPRKDSIKIISVKIAVLKLQLLRRIHEAMNSRSGGRISFHRNREKMVLHKLVPHVQAS